MHQRALRAIVDRALNDPVSSNRLAALHALQDFDDPTVVSTYLDRAANDQDESVRNNAIRYFSRPPRADGFEPLADLLLSGKHPRSAASVASVLMEIDQHKAWPIIIDAAEQDRVDDQRLRLLTIASQRPDLRKGRYIYWPTDADGLRELIRNTYTIVGEGYGETEIGEVVKNLEHPNSVVRGDCVSALGYLRTTMAVAPLLRLAEESKGGSRYHAGLMALGTPEAIQFLCRSIQDAENARQRYSIVRRFDEARADRWAVPILIALLDDPGLIREVPDIGPGRSGMRPPPVHAAHSALHAVLRDLGFKTSTKNLPRGGTVNLKEEITGLEHWWAEHGEAFLKDEPVPSPKITSWFWSS